uniref:C-type lectin domain-containing protein n=1 Tax=Astyanax mexicanus TaxID=7994 RepID=A0A3B1J9R5_ASTMX
MCPFRHLQVSFGISPSVLSGISKCPFVHLQVSFLVCPNVLFGISKCPFGHLQKNMTWEEALNYCRDTYTDLASLTSYQENTLAVRKSTKAEVSHVWIGLHFVVRYWIWVDGHALEYQAWSEDEDPNTVLCSYYRNQWNVPRAKGRTGVSRSSFKSA